MITLHNISKIYQQSGREITALHPTSLHVNAGEIYGVVGESGAGKSTLIRCVNLLERPSSGEVIVDGQSLTTLSPAQLLKARHSNILICLAIAASPKISPCPWNSSARLKHKSKLKCKPAWNSRD